MDFPSCHSGAMTSSDLEQAVGREPVRRLVSKVPEITVYFWITKVLTTGMGETTSDYLAHRLDPVIAVGIAGIAFVASLVLQFSVRRYVPWVYWLAVVMVSIFGTMAADGVHVQLGIPYVVSAVFFAVVLAVILVTWYACEKTLSIHSIHTRRRELFYWATVMTTFALGTAVGDLSANTLHWGYFVSGVVFAVIFAVPALGHWRFGMAAIPAFWFAYIVTRPFGASFADWVGVTADRGGLGWGTGPVSLGLAMVILVLVGYLTSVDRDVARGDSVPR
jgi:uncharacterized membrane-anchored protein